MKISDLTNDTLTRLFNARHPIMLLGVPGIGKTERIIDYANDMGLGCVADFDLTSVESVDLRGIPVPIKREGQAPITKFTESPLLDAIRRTGKDQGILFLDEFLQAGHDVQKAAAPLLSARRLGDNYLPDGWVVWMASNPPESRAGTNRMLGHMPSRMCVLDIEPDAEGWAGWASTKGIHPMPMAFAGRRPGVVFSTETPKNPDAPRCNSRSFTRAAMFLAQDADGMTLRSDPITQEIVAGMIGEGAAVELFAFMKVVDQLPTLEEVLHSPDTAKLPDMDRMDAQYAAMAMCVHSSTNETVDKLFRYIKRLPRELQTGAATQLVKRSGGTLLNSRELGQWVGENTALIANSMA